MINVLYHIHTPDLNKKKSCTFSYKTLLIAYCLLLIAYCQGSWYRYGLDIGWYR